MYESQGINDIYFLMLYGGAATFALVAGLYLLFRRSNAIEPSINSSKPYITVDDETAPYNYDYLVTVVDSAKITKDGDTVVGGNKVKIGIPITLESAKYKLNGVISNVVAYSAPDSNVIEDLDKHTKLNQDVH